MSHALRLAAVALLAACSRPPALPPAVATFGNDAVRLPELEAEVERVRQEVRPRGENAADAVTPDAEQQQAIRRGVLDQLVDRHLLLAAAREAGVTITDEELDEALRTHTALALEPEAPRDPAAIDAARARLRDDLTLDRYLVREVAARVAIAPDEAKTWYDQHRGDFERPDQVRCSQIAVPRHEDAAALKVQLTRGSDFARLAREQSMSDDKARGGDLGWFAKGQMPAEFEKACFSLRKGEVSDVVQSPYGYHLFKLFDRREGARIPFGEAEPRIERRLRRDRVAAAQAELVGKLREKAGVRYHDVEPPKAP